MMASMAADAATGVGYAKLTAVCSKCTATSMVPWLRLSRHVPAESLLCSSSGVKSTAPRQGGKIEPIIVIQLHDHRRLDEAAEGAAVMAKLVPNRFRLAYLTPGKRLLHHHDGVRIGEAILVPRDKIARALDAQPTRHASAFYGRGNGSSRASE